MQLFSNQSIKFPLILSDQSFRISTIPTLMMASLRKIESHSGPVPDARPIGPRAPHSEPTLQLPNRSRFHHFRVHLLLWPHKIPISLLTVCTEKTERGCLRSNHFIITSESRRSPLRSPTFAPKCNLQCLQDKESKGAFSRMSVSSLARSGRTSTAGVMEFCIHTV
jgi:hypothetical protein